ncbi:putative transmembrane protein [Toxoplasma gondii TgCatPRC2]|uniref:Putative transmembrane protein n=1 Tax=Toxoplasma gondii TgCatPRC2 TaxID=1130821 RepID=A0A151H9X0_TOXGO|nr:putative transmembrane protein [Toxoplasma gondii TgCatPRC2]
MTPADSEHRTRARTSTPAVWLNIVLIVLMVSSSFATCTASSMRASRDVHPGFAFSDHVWSAYVPSNPVSLQETTWSNELQSTMLPVLARHPLGEGKMPWTGAVATGKAGGDLRTGAAGVSDPNDGATQVEQTEEPMLPTHFLASVISPVTTFLWALDGDLKGSLDSLDKALAADPTQTASRWSPLHLDALTDPSRTDDCRLVEKRTPESLDTCKIMVIEIPMPPYDLGNIAKDAWEKATFPERLFVWGFELSCRSYLECSQNMDKTRPDLFDGIYLYNGVDAYGAPVYIKEVSDELVMLEDGLRITNIFLICSLPDADGASGQLPWAAIFPHESNARDFERRPYPFAYINDDDIPVPQQSSAGVESSGHTAQDALQISRLTYSRTRWHLVPPGEATQAIRFFPAIVKVKPI